MREGICINYPICGQSKDCTKCEQKKLCCEKYPDYVPSAPCPICGHDMCICKKEK